MAAAPRHVERRGGLTAGKRGVGVPVGLPPGLCDRHEDRVAALARDMLRQVALAGRVLDEAHVTGTLLSKVGWAKAKRGPPIGTSRPNHTVHVTVARLRFGIKLKSLGLGGKR